MTFVPEATLKAAAAHLPQETDVQSDAMIVDVIS